MAATNSLSMRLAAFVVAVGDVFVTPQPRPPYPGRVGHVNGASHARSGRLFSPPATTTRITFSQT